jgi:hypothetical protein
VTPPPAGWYPDPEDPSGRRYWDGAQWTPQRRPSQADGDRSPIDPAADRRTPRSEAGGMGAIRRLGDSARKSSLAQGLKGNASSVGRGVLDTARDPARRQAILAAAAPAMDAALDGAEVRNRHGEVKTWRVVRAATRPRRTLSGAGSGVMAAAAGGRLADASRRAAESDPGLLRPSDEDIASEWPMNDPREALPRWSEGKARLAAADQSDIEALSASARLLCEALKHCLVGRPVLNDDDIVDTAGMVLFAVVTVPDDRSWGGENERMARLALGVARRLGVQPEELGGNGELSPLFADSRNRMRMAMSVAPGPWSCDLSRWFAGGGSAP